MKKIAAMLFALLMLAFAPVQAQAKFMFGSDEMIHHIQDVTLKGAKDEALFLAFKTTKQFFGLGLYVQDDGYVLGVQGESKRYYKMPEGAELASFQQRGLLPNPLPKYELGIFEYLFGYSLWLVLGGFGLWWLVKFLRGRGKAAEPA